MKLSDLSDEEFVRFAKRMLEEAGVPYEEKPEGVIFSGFSQEPKFFLKEDTRYIEYKKLERQVSYIKGEDQLYSTPELFVA